MSYARYLKDMLEPMGVYRLENSLNGAELESAGAALDGVDQVLEEVEREMLLLTAEDWGLSAVEALLRRRPAAPTLEQRREALAALLRIGGDSFTLEAINDTLRGCGLQAVASETGTPGYVEVRFPDVPGIPDGIETMQAIIEEILPAHVGITYVYWFSTWAELEEQLETWGDIEELGLTWGEMEKMVEEEEEL
ncbi:MAG TPA: YmfQ family protein [Candidatus Flavonifractor intestinipullorum]|uniref:YmfQ family protein n=1 Tax=Candidatus Flavonifractor intestinipullorum TaxID=2838587 RepID=A0A9D2MA00_9FIRM|nr:YmfQ family protein [Candidatus Flavonifractor intestinipullorum]